MNQFIAVNALGVCSIITIAKQLDSTRSIYCTIRPGPYQGWPLAVMHQGWVQTVFHGAIKCCFGPVSGSLIPFDLGEKGVYATYTQAVILPILELGDDGTAEPGFNPGWFDDFVDSLAAVAARLDKQVTAAVSAVAEQ